jgi:hypothetical protein
MSDHALIHKLQPFKGKMLIDCIDKIKFIAELNGGYRVNVIDPKYNTGSIDNEPDRLNVRIDKESFIISFTIG